MVYCNVHSIGVCRYSYSHLAQLTVRYLLTHTHTHTLTHLHTHMCTHAHTHTHTHRFLQAYTSSVKDITAHLVSHSGPSHLTFIGRARTKHSSPAAVMDHLSCFYPGTLALGLMNRVHPDQRALAQELTRACYSAYKAMPSGIAPEIFHFNTRDEGSDFMTRGVPSVVSCHGDVSGWSSVCVCSVHTLTCIVQTLITKGTCLPIMS